ncbi:MAG: family transposase [Firmicutes bacterium]|nr:family transposase [Bacillota bacterium]
MIYIGTLSVKTTLRRIKYLNNIIEQDHRFIKRKIKPMLGFDSFITAEKAICGIEAMHMIRKGQVEEIQSALSEVKFFNKIMGIAA